MPPSSSTSKTPPMIAQQMLKTIGTENRQRSVTAMDSNNPSTKKSYLSLSNSVLASCDTLPSFPMTPGILSPETVQRMDEMTEGGNGNEAVSTFLKAYRQMGPLSCLEMLSDPEILPHLTKAMRDII